MTPGTSYSPPPAFGRFRLLHQIGAGVLGPVFRTDDEQEQHLVAVKAFTLDLTPERAEELSNQLQRVVDIDLEHPHIARPIATGVEASVAFLAQQYAAGESLDAAIRQYGPAPANDVVRLIGHVAEALDVAASVGVFHGSLHPRDILVTPGETHLTGLGVSAALEAIGQHGPIRRPYAAPERESGLEWGAAADVFSLAVIAYEVLTGRRALPGTEHALPGLAELQVHDAAALREILETAIDPDPDRRPAKAGEFAHALAAALVDPATTRPGGERPAGSRRKIKPRAPKLPGLDEPLAPQDASAVVLSASLDGGRPRPTLEYIPESGEDLHAPIASVDSFDATATPPEAMERETPVAPDEDRYELGGQPDDPEAKSAPAPDEDVAAPDPSPSEPSYAEEDIHVAPTLVLRPSRSSQQADEVVASDLASAPEFVEPVAEMPEAPGPDRPIEEEPEAGPLGLDLVVPRAIDPTRDSGSYSRPLPRGETGRASGADRVMLPIAVAAMAGLLLGLLGGYEIGARWGQRPLATIAAVPTAPASEPAVPPATVAPVTAVVSSAVSTAPPVSGDAVPNVKASAAAPVPAKRAEAPSTARAASAPRKAAVRKPAAAAARGAAAAATKATSLSVASHPAGARVLLDGKEVGITPFVLKHVAPGRHAIVLRLEGFRRWTTSITIVAGKPQRVAASLERDDER